MPTNRISLWLLGTSLVSCVLPRLAAAAGPGEAVWTFQGIEDVLCADEIEDQNGDGVPDVVVETYDAGAVGDHLWCLSGGAAGPAAETIWSVKPPGGPSNSGGYGDKCLTTAPDLNGDGIQDVLLGTAWGGRTAYAIDGTDGSVIWDFDTYVDRPPAPAVSGWVYSIVSVSDVDDDQVPDVFFTCGSDNNRVYHASGATGEILYSLEMGDAVFSAAGLDDVSGDGLADGVFGVGDNAESIWCLRGLGPPLQTLWNQTMPGTVYALARIADVTGDGVNDVLAGIWASAVYCFNGATGAVEWISPLPSGAFVMRIAVLDDVDGDGFQDAAIASWANSAIVISGADGDEIWQRNVGGDVWAIERVEDVNGDGINDVVAGSFDHFVYMLDGVTGMPEWSFDTGNRLYFVTGTSDLTGNTVPDVFAGSQKLSGPGGQGFLLEGGDPAATPAGLPMFVDGTASGRGIEVRLRNADRFSSAWVERTEGAGSAAAAQRFRAEVAQAYLDGELTAREAVQARAQDPEVAWTRLTSVPIAVRAGEATYVDATAISDRTYRYRFAFAFEDHVIGYSPILTIEGAADGFAVPEMTVRPNPLLADALSIEFRLREPQTIRLAAYDAAGRRVAVVHAAERAAEAQSVSWNGRDESGRPLPNGVYFLRLDGRDFVSTKKVTILR